MRSSDLIFFCICGEQRHSECNEESHAVCTSCAGDGIYNVLQIAGESFRLPRAGLPRPYNSYIYYILHFSQPAAMHILMKISSLVIFVEIRYHLYIIIP